MAGERGAEPKGAENWPEDLVARLRALEAKNRELAAALALAHRQIAFYRSYHTLVQEVIAQALAVAFQVGGEGGGPSNPGPDVLGLGLPPHVTPPPSAPLARAQEEPRDTGKTEARLTAEVAALEQGLAALREQLAGLGAPPPASPSKPTVPTYPATGSSHQSGTVDGLTRRELDVLHLMAQGLGNRDIADRLFISEKTVKSHITAIFGKLQVTDRTQAVLYAVRNGLTA